MPTTKSKRIIVLLGNDGPRADHLTKSETRVEFWEGIDDPDMVKLAVSTDNDKMLVHRHDALADEHKRFAVCLHEVEDLWPYHSSVSKPSYVASNDEDLQAALADYYGCPQGQFTALLTHGGQDALHGQHWGTSTQAAQFNFLAISTSTGSAFANTDTTLASEITTNGLGRASSTFAHTTGTATSTLTHTWTYTGSTSVTAASMGTFNASSAGTLGEEDALASSVTVTTSGDTITVTYTGTTSG